MGAGASSPGIQTPSEDSKEEKRKVAKIPLNIALVAIVKIQTRWRIKLAFKRFEIVKFQVLEERRKKELIRLARAAELDEIVPLETSAPLRTVPGKLNNQNRFLRKFATKKQIEDTRDIDVYQEGKGDAAMVLTKFSPLDNNHLVIHPLVGFVIKSRSNLTGKKIFINICHHESIVTMVAAPVREVTDTVAASFATDSSTSGSTSRPFTANSGYNLSSINGHTGINSTVAAADSLIQIGDVLLPSQEFEECFVRDDDAGLVPVNARVRQEIAKQAVKYWNLTHNDDVALACTFPKIKRGYFGDLLPLSLELKSKSVEHVPSALHESTSLLAELARKDESDLFSSFAIAPTRSANNPLEPVHLPYATEFRTWVDVAAVGTDLPLPDTYYGKSPVEVASCLAVLTHVQSLDTHGHSVKFSSRELSDRVVRELRVESFVPQVPLFGPAYAAQTASGPTSTTALVTSSLSASTLPAIPGTQSSSAAGSKMVLVAPPTVTPAPPAASKPTAHAPRTPGQNKAARSATIGPGSPQRTAKPPNFSTDSAFDDANTAARTGAAWRPSGATSLKVPTKEKVDDFGVALEHFSSEMAAQKGALKTQEEEDREENTTEPAAELADAPADTPAAVEAPSVVTHSTVPAFVMLSQGVLYLYNRDPTRSHYYPFKPPKKRKYKHASDPAASIAELPFSPAKSKPPAASAVPVFRSLILYARIMLTDTCVTTSVCDTDRDTESGTSSSHCAHYLHFTAPGAQLDAAEDSLAELLSYFGTALPERNVTIKVRSFSELRTWKAHLRSHIQLGKLVRKRIFHHYAGNTEVNRYLMGRTVAAKHGDLILRTSNGERKFHGTVDNGILSLYNVDQNEDKKPLFAVGLEDKIIQLQPELRNDNSTDVILSVTSEKPDKVHNLKLEFLFHRPYAMIETESSEYFEALQLHIQQARARVSATVLPLLEHKQGISIPGQRADITSVKLAVGGSDDVDSDDEDEDEIEAALRRHTLLTTFYVSHPFPDQLAKDTVDLILSNPALKDLSVALKSNPNEVHNVVVRHENEAITQEIITSLQKGMGEMPPFTIVLVNKLLYFFHAMRYYFSLNLSHLGDKLAYKRARALHKAEVLKLKQEILHKRMKESVFYIDSSSEDELTDNDEKEEDDDENVGNQENPSVMTGFLSRGPSTSSLDGANSLAPPANSLTPSRPANRPGARSARPHSVKSIDAAAPPIDDSTFEKARHPMDATTSRPAAAQVRILLPSVAPSNYSITTWAIRLVSYDNRSYTMNFKSAEEYENWRQLLFDAGAEPVPDIEPEIELFLPAKIQSQQHKERAETKVSENQKEDALQQPETTSISKYNVDSRGSIEREAAPTPLATPLKSPTFLFPAVSGFGAATGADKLDAKYVDLDAVKKYARLLRKEEQVLACGQVFKHDILPPSKSTTSGKRESPSNSKQRRILVLTDLPRLLFLDPVGNIVRGNLELTSAAAKVDVKTTSAVDFDVVVSGVTNKFTSTELPEKGAVFWTTKIKQALGQR